MMMLMMTMMLMISMMTMMVTMTMMTMMLMLMMLMVMLVIMVVGGIPVTVSVSQSLSEAAEANFPPLYFSYLFSSTFHICSLQLFIFVLCKTNTSSNPVDWGNQVGQVWSIPFNEEKKVKKIYLS